MNNKLSLFSNKLRLSESAVLDKRKFNLTEIYRPDTAFKVLDLNEIKEGSEYAKYKNRKGIIGVVVGQFFGVNEDSLNGRHYTEEFWVDVLANPELQERLRRETMAGKIGHELDPVSDEDWNKGRVSHKIVKLWISEDKKGMGIALIFNNEAGRNLKTYLDSGTILGISSRAGGDSSESEFINNLPVVLSEGFYLDTFDFVTEQGIESAIPKLLENKGKKGDNMTLEELGQMVLGLQESVNKLQKQKPAINEDKGNNSDIQKTINTLNESVSKITNELNEHKKQTSFLESFEKPVLEKLQKISNNELSEMFNKTIKVSGRVHDFNYVDNGRSLQGVLIPCSESVENLGKVHESLGIFDWTKDKRKYPHQVKYINEGNVKGIALLWNENEKPEILNENKEKVSLSNFVNDIVDFNSDLYEGKTVDTMKGKKLLSEFLSINEDPKLIMDSLETFVRYIPVVKEVNKLGNVKDITNNLKVLESLTNKIHKLSGGTGLEGIEKALKVASKVIDTVESQKKKSNRLKLESTAKNISKEFEIPLTDVTQLLTKHNEAFVRSHYKKFAKNANLNNNENNGKVTQVKSNPENSKILNIVESYGGIQKATGGAN